MVLFDYVMLVYMSPHDELSALGVIVMNKILFKSIKVIERTNIYKTLYSVNKPFLPTKLFLVRQNKAPQHK